MGTIKELQKLCAVSTLPWDDYFQGYTKSQEEIVQYCIQVNGVRVCVYNITVYRRHRYIGNITISYSAVTSQWISLSLY